MSIHAVVAFLGAFLLFLVQPLLGKAILPWFGGTPAVWSTCLVFFQVMLLAGYAAAHATTRLAGRYQAGLYVILLVLSLAQLPIAPLDTWKPVGTESPVWRIFGLLTLTVGTPYLLLAATAPLVQRWASQRAGAASPYKLYAVSNAGSLLGLLAYPFLIERFLTLHSQMVLWSTLFGTFAVVAGWLAVDRVRLGESGGGDEERESVSRESAPPPARTRALWFALPAAASGLLVAATNEICLNIAVIPFLWVLPLTLYLLTFMLAFANRYSRRFASALFLAGLVGVSVLNLIYATALWQIAGASFVLFGGAFVCHGELARLAPDARRLTAYYLAIATGGAVGGIFVALGAPILFREFWEFPLFLLLAYLLFLAATGRNPAAVLARRHQRLAWVALVLAPCLVVASFAWSILGRTGDTVVTARNFFGILRVYDNAPPQTPLLRRFQHGRIVHGMQFLDPARRAEPTAYYRSPSGIDIAIRRHPARVAGAPLRIGVIGLGVGTIAALSVPGDRIRFYEINPQVTEIAHEYFTFLKDSPAASEVVPGDARLSLEREVISNPTETFDILVVDAFSGDAIPVHLLTREAAALYWRVLRKDGILVFNVTNRYLNVAPVVRGLAQDAGKDVVQVIGAAKPQEGALASDWMLVTSNQPFLAAARGPRVTSARAAPSPSLVWTDGFSNLFDVLR